MGTAAQRPLQNPHLGAADIVLNAAFAESRRVRVVRQAGSIVEDHISAVDGRKL